MNALAKKKDPVQSVIDQRIERNGFIIVQGNARGVDSKPAPYLYTAGLVTQRLPELITMVEDWPPGTANAILLAVITKMRMIIAKNYRWGGSHDIGSSILLRQVSDERIYQKYMHNAAERAPFKRVYRVVNVRESQHCRFKALETKEV